MPYKLVHLNNQIHTPVKLLPATDFIERSDDSYIAVRSAYLQKRKYDIYNGNLCGSVIIVAGLELTKITR
jgi:ABC-type transporter lipoprotein component MlaA